MKNVIIERLLGKNPILVVCISQLSDVVSCRQGIQCVFA